MVVVKFVKQVVCVMSTMYLTACSALYSTNAKDQYLRSHNGPDLVVEKPLTTSYLSYFYTLPPQKNKVKVDLKPPKEGDD